MSSHPRSSVIFQYTGMLINLEDVDYACLLEPTEQDTSYYVSVSMRASPKSVKLRVADFEAGMVIVARIKRGMVSAMNGEFWILDNDQPPDHGEGDDDEPDEPESESRRPEPDL